MMQLPEMDFAGPQGSSVSTDLNKTFSGKISLYFKKDE